MKVIWEYFPSLDSATGWTSGTASTSVYAWATGSYVVTATAGGKTSTSTVSFAQKTPTYARTITAAVSGGTVTATVKDRYGNAVPNVTVWATKSGTGYFGSGSSSTSGTTSEAGTVDFYVNGSASVTLSLGSSTAADANYGQSGSALGYVKQGDGATPAAVTASAAGTASFVDANGKSVPLGKITVSKSGRVTIPALTFGKKNVSYTIKITIGGKTTSFTVRGTD